MQVTKRSIRITIYREKMAFFTRSKVAIPIMPGEEEDISEDDWEEELEERRTPDGRSSKTSYERRDRDSQTCQKQEECQSTSECNDTKAEVVDCKNPCLNPEPCYENLPVRNEDVGEQTDDKETKTDDVRYDFVVDRVLGVQV